ncbi:molecular chaperone HtpG [Firmicutes bacterium AM55-24TS]|jgi:molecular chaperone HtpG|nr:molecular chaperone HtpG [Firmicutes bacterium AM55-24TS]RHP10406.1 molecular chaperone HtpG [Firmicutes bacterium AF36-3BH]
MAKGNISVDSENLFPIIKKWLYSDKDIFLRELVSNGCDAVTKLKKLASIGEAQIDENEKFKVTVSIFKDAKKLVISDNGIGMTAEEIDKYINQIAFSGASDFLSKYKEEDDKGSQIIGHFGLGFYSAFMVADSVEIDSLSYQDGAKAAKWICDGSMEFDLTDGDRTERGTTITLNIAEDSEEFLEESTIRQILHKYCAFLPIEIYVEVPEDKHEDHCDCGHDHDHEHEDDTPSEPKPINNTTPLWMKKPSECTDEEYKEFYRNVFMDFNEPLFWIHLNVDYPFNLKGILYFPKINHEFAGQEGQIKLYNNQVFVADNVKEVIPEFLMLLKGVIDCPDLPLNVSRSFLQNDGYVKKISSHITKKVADKLTSIYNNERENYEKYWDYINIFIKYGCLRDEKFYEKVKDVIIYKDIDGKYLTLNEYLDGKEEKDVYYVSDPQTQSQYINMFKNQGLNAVVLPSMMDTHFISLVEMKQTGVKFKRIDSAINDISDNTEKDDSTKEQEEKLIEKFKNEINDHTLKIEVQSLKDDSIPAVILLGEQSRRMQEMYKAYGQQMAGMADMFHDEFTLVLNSNNSLIKKIDTLNDEDANLVIDHVYDLAKISHSPLPAEQMTKFIERSNKLLEKLF